MCVLYHALLGEEEMNKRNLSCGQIVSFCVLVFVLITLGVSTSARASGEGTLNEFVTFEVLGDSSYATSDTYGCTEGSVGKFIFDARLTNTSTRTHSKLQVEVSELTNGNLLQNADGGPGGVLSRLTIPKTGDYSDGVLTPGEYVDINFIICLSEWKQFSFLVDVLGASVGNQCDENASIELRNLSVNSDSSVINLCLNETRNVVWSVDFKTESSEQWSGITLSQEVSPDGGLTLLSGADTQWTVNESATMLVDQSITGSAVGTYVIRTKANIDECPEDDENPSEHVLTVNVVAPGLNCVTAIPSAISVVSEQGIETKQTRVFFTTDFAEGPCLADEESCLEDLKVVVQRINASGEVQETYDNEPLKDDGGGYIIGVAAIDNAKARETYGSSGDLHANDGIYSGFVTIKSGKEEGVLYFRTSAFISCAEQTTVSTCIKKIHVTGFPIGLDPEQPEKTVCVVDDDGYPILDKDGYVVDGDAYPNDERFVCDEVLVRFKEGIDSFHINKIVDEIEGTIIESVFAYETFIVKLPTCDCPTGVNSALEKLSRFDEVLLAGKNNIGIGGSLTPNDFDDGNDWGPKAIGAKDAWERIEAKKEIDSANSQPPGDLVILDTGVKGDHDDFIKSRTPLTSRVSDDDVDPHGHGTKVAGIAAAEGDNGTAIAGISWDCNIISKQVLENNANMDWNNSKLLAALGEIEGSGGNKVVNFSGFSVQPTPSLLSALASLYDNNILFVTIAHNLEMEGDTPKEGEELIETVYPGSYSKVDVPGEFFEDGVERKLDNIMVVGSIDQTGEVAVFSQNKPVVDIYAPGVGIRTTFNDGSDGISGEGNSFAAPFVSGAATAIWNYVTPGTGEMRWEAVKRILLAEADKRLNFDLAVQAAIPQLPTPVEFDILNGSFEDGLNNWDSTGVALTTSSLQNIQTVDPVNGATMAMLITTLDSSASLSQNFTVPAGVEVSSISFNYVFTSIEPARGTKHMQPDTMTISLSGGVNESLKTETIDISGNTIYYPLDFGYGGFGAANVSNDVAVWSTVNASLSTPLDAGEYTFKIEVAHGGNDGIYDSIVFVDEIVFVNN